MGIIGKLLRRGPHDPLWDRFINQAPREEVADMSGAIRTAPAGNVFPVVADVPEPERMACDLHELAVFFGANGFGVTKTQSTLIAPLAEGAEMPDIDALPNMIVVSVPMEVDPDRSAGIGGQHARREAATVVFSLGAYIRELGFQAVVTPINRQAAATAAGLTPGHKSFVADDAVLTDLPLTPGAPALPDTPISRRPTTARNR